MLFSRYAGAVEYVLNLDFEFGIELINKAMEKKNEEDIFLRWVIGGYEKEIDLSEFKRELRVEPTSTKPVKEKSEREIYEEVKNILRMRRK